MGAVLQRRAVVVLVPLLLSGCSAIKLAYDNADGVIAWMVDDYLDLDREQEEGLRPLLARLHAWHRTTQLPEYARLLDTAQRRLAQGLTAADVSWAAEAIAERYRILAERACEDAVRVLSTLSDEQVAYLRRKLDEANAEWGRKHGIGAPPEEQRRRRAKRLLERIEHWSGTLTPGQTERLTALIDAMPLITEQSLQFRLRRQSQFLALLDHRHDVDALDSGLHAWLLDTDRSRAPEYGSAYVRFQEARTRLYVEGFALLSAAQRDHVADRLRRYSQAVRELSEEAPRPSNLAAARLPPGHGQ